MHFHTEELQGPGGTSRNQNKTSKVLRYRSQSFSYLQLLTHRCPHCPRHSKEKGNGAKIEGKRLATFRRQTLSPRPGTLWRFIAFSRAVCSEEREIIAQIPRENTLVSVSSHREALHPLQPLHARTCLSSPKGRRTRAVV